MTLRTGPQGSADGAGAHSRYDTDVMSTAANYFENLLSEMTGGVNRLMLQLDPLSTDWTGDAAKAFHDARDRWAITHKDLMNAGGEIVSALRSNVTDLSGSEADSTHGLRSASRALL